MTDTAATIDSIKSHVLANLWTLEKRVERADRIYANHVIASRTETSWLIMGTDKTAFWAEIMVGRRGALVITGDGPDMILRSWYDHEKPSGLVSWVGRSNPDYMEEKVQVGERLGFDGKKALLDVLDFFEESPEEELREEIREDIAALRDRVLEDCERQMASIARWKKASADASGTAHESVHSCELSEEEASDIWKEIYEITGDSELGQFGKVVSDDLLRTQAACRRLAALLEAEEGPVSDGE